MGPARFRPHMLLAALALASIASTDAAQARFDDHDDDGRLHTLRPGEFVVQKQVVPVDIVLIGYERGQIDERALLKALPATYVPVVRFPLFYGLNGRDVGLQFRFKYRVVRRSRSFENQFFSFLAQTGTTGPLTQFQDQYNQQKKNVLDVKGPVLYIDAPTVEAVPGTPRRERRAALHHLLHQLVQPPRLPVPRLHEDRRARPRYRLQLRNPARLTQDDRVGRHDVTNMVLRSLGRSRIVDQQLERG